MLLRAVGVGTGLSPLPSLRQSAQPGPDCRALSSWLHWQPCCNSKITGDDAFLQSDEMHASHQAEGRHALTQEI